ADERHTVRQSHITAGLSGQHQRAEKLRPIRVAPAEVVEQSDAARIGTDGNHIADGLINRRGRHRIRIEVAGTRIDTAANRQALPGTGYRGHHRRITGTIHLHAYERLEHRSALDLVIILADDPFLAANVRAGEDLEEGFGEWSG